MPDFLGALSIVLSALTIASDLYAHRVRNIWLLTTLLLGAAWMVWRWGHGMAGPPWAALEGCLVGLLVLLPVYLLGWMGAGDVKFFAVLGFLLGAKILLPIWVIGSLLAGLHALVVLGARCLSSRYRMDMLLPLASLRGTRLWQQVAAARQGREGLPFAAYLAVGVLCTFVVPDLKRW